AARLDDPAPICLHPPLADGRRADVGQYRHAPPGAAVRQELRPPPPSRHPGRRGADQRHAAARGGLTGGATMSLATTDLTPRIGAEIRIDKPAMLSGDFAGEIRAILERRGVFVIRDAHLSDEEEIVFAATLGTIRIDFGRPIMRVTFDKTKNPDHSEYF